MTDIINTLLPFIPEKYRGLVAVLITTSPLITRAAYALMNGRGIKGTLSAIWLGTNTPAPSQSSPPASGGISKTVSALVALCAASLLFTGCASIASGNRAVVVRAEQSISLANATLDSAVHIDDANRSWSMSHAPAFHQFCEWLRAPVVMLPLTNSLPRGLAIVASADAVKETYKRTNNTNDYALLISSLAVVESATAQAQKFIAATATATK